MADSPDTRYRAALGRVRSAFIKASSLSDAERQVGLLMLECVNRRAAIREGRLSCWPGNGWLARHGGLEWRSVQKARSRLRELGAIVEILGRCPEQGELATPRYGFGPAWVAAIEAEVNSRPEISKPLTKKEKQAKGGAPPFTPTARPVVGCTESAVGGEQSVREGVHHGSPKPYELKPSNKTFEGAHAPKAAFQEGRDREIQHYRPPSRLLFRSIEDEHPCHIQWTTAIDRLHRLNPKFNEHFISNVIVAYATDAESVEIQDSRTISARLRAILQDCITRANTSATERTS